MAKNIIMIGQTLLSVCMVACNARSLQQSFASAVSVSGGSGPFGNCGATQTIGNAEVYLLTQTSLFTALLGASRGITQIELVKGSVHIPFDRRKMSWKTCIRDKVGYTFCDVDVYLTLLPVRAHRISNSETGRERAFNLRASKLIHAGFCKRTSLCWHYTSATSKYRLPRKSCLCRLGFGSYIQPNKILPRYRIHCLQTRWSCFTALKSSWYHKSKRLRDYHVYLCSDAALQSSCGERCLSTLCCRQHSQLHVEH